jgi:Domain of unknown function (DUF3576)
MKNRKSRLAAGLALAALGFFLAACGPDNVQTDASYDNPERDKLYQNGSLLSDKGGADLLDLGGSDNTPQTSGIGVNGFLWRATLDTISFMPIASADPFGGVIITDWYSTPGDPNERMKLNVFIRGRELRADGVKVTVFRKTRDASGGWTDAPVAASTGGALENTILTKARQIRLAQKDIQ